MRRVGFIMHPGYSPMGFAVTTAFEIANLQASESVYDLHVLSKDGGPIRTSVGFRVETDKQGKTTRVRYFKPSRRAAKPTKAKASTSKAKADASTSSAPVDANEDAE